MCVVFIVIILDPIYIIGFNCVIKTKNKSPKMCFKTIKIMRTSNFSVHNVRKTIPFVYKCLLRQCNLKTQLFDIRLIPSLVITLMGDMERLFIQVIISSLKTVTRKFGNDFQQVKVFFLYLASV